MMDDGLSVCLPDDPTGNAKLMFSILECLSKSGRVSAVVVYSILDCLYSFPPTKTEHSALSDGPHQVDSSECGSQQDDLTSVGNLFWTTVFVSRRLGVGAQGDSGVQVFA